MCDLSVRAVELLGDFYALPSDEHKDGSTWTGEQCTECGADTFRVEHYGLRCIGAEDGDEGPDRAGCLYLHPWRIVKARAAVWL